MSWIHDRQGRRCRMVRRTRQVLIAMGLGLVALLPSCSYERAQTQSEEPTEQQLIFRDEEGRELTWSDLEHFTVVFNDGIPGETEISVSPEAHELHDQGRDLGQRGEFDQAIDCFERAHELAPDWPYPFYDTAFTYLLMGDSEKALDYYGRVDQMSPGGFLTVKAAVDTLLREQAGTVKEGTYLLLVQLEQMNDTQQKKEIVERLLAETPELPFAWQILASLAEDDEEALTAINEGLSYQPDAATRGTLLLNKSLILFHRNNNDEAIEILSRLILDPESTTDTVLRARLSLIDIIGSEEN
jgi:tetratricopeptide (TPR) repeat protein